MAQILKIENGVRPFAVAEIIDAKELARRWQVPLSWLRDYTRPDRTDDLIPHARLSTTLHRFGVPDKDIQQILRDQDVQVTQTHIKTATADALSGMQVLRLLM